MKFLKVLLFFVGHVTYKYLSVDAFSPNPMNIILSKHSFSASVRGSAGAGDDAPRPSLSILFSQQNGNQNQNQNGYRSIADVVGGLHGGKYEFGGDSSSPSQSFDGRGRGGKGQSRFASLLDDDDDDDDDDNNEEEIPNWALKMQPPPHIANAPMNVGAVGAVGVAEIGVETISIKSNADPMDGMVHSSTVIIQNEERTWEKFHAKIMVRNEDGEFITVARTKDDMQMDEYAYEYMYGGCQTKARSLGA
jgi:hypothetical protein